MGKNLYRERFEQLNIVNSEIYKKELKDSATLIEVLKEENAMLRERLRLIGIAAKED